MKPINLPIGDTPANSFSVLQANALLLQARTLQAHALQGDLLPLLQGKTLALMSGRSRSDEAHLFRRAATELGAHVSTVRPSLSDKSSQQEVVSTARMLSRLYSFVECQDLPRGLVERLAAAASIPIVCGLACDEHPVAALSTYLPGEAPITDKRRWLLQAMLLTAID